MIIDLICSSRCPANTVLDITLITVVCRKCFLGQRGYFSLLSWEWPPRDYWQIGQMLWCKMPPASQVCFFLLIYFFLRFWSYHKVWKICTTAPIPILPHLKVRARLDLNTSHPRSEYKHMRLCHCWDAFESEIRPKQKTFQFKSSSLTDGWEFSPLTTTIDCTSFYHSMLPITKPLAESCAQIHLKNFRSQMRWETNRHRRDHATPLAAPSGPHQMLTKTFDKVMTEHLNVTTTKRLHWIWKQQHSPC